MAIAATAVAQEMVTFEQHVMPIFRERCLACHSQDDASSGLALDSYNASLAGGASGEVLASADTGGSRLWKLVTHEEEPVMPPGDKLPDDQLAIIKAWIDGGLLKNAGSKPKPSKKPSIAEVAVDPNGRPQGKPAMPQGMFRQPVLTADHTGPVVSLAASRWAPVVALPWQRQVSFYHSDNHQLLGVAPYVDGLPQVIRFSRDGSLLLVAGGRNGAAGNAALYDVKTGARLTTLGNELDTVLAADISPDNRVVAIGGPKKKVRAFHVVDGSMAYELTKHTDWITALAFSPDGKLLATGDRSAGLRTWDAQEGFERGDLRGHGGTITSISWRPDAAAMASTSEDGTLRLWNQDGVQIKSSGAHSGGALSVAFAPDGRLVTAGRDQMVKLWKPDGNHLGDLLRMTDDSMAAVFVGEGKQVLASDYVGNVRLIDIESKHVVASFAANPPTLQNRMSEATTKLAQAEAEQEQSSENTQTAVAALDQGQNAHQTYQARLKQAKAILAASKKSCDELTIAATDADSVLVKADDLLASLRQQVEQIEKAVKESKEQDLGALEVAQRTVAEKRIADLDRQQVEAHSALVAATSAQGKAAEMHAAAQKRLKSAQLKLGNSEKLLADARNRRAELPDLAALAKTRDQAQSASAQAAEAVKQLAQNRDMLAAELQTFARAAARLSADAQAESIKQNKLARRLGAAEAQRATAAKKVDEHSQKINQVELQIEQFQQQLRSLREQKVELTGKLDNSEQRLAKTQQQLAEAEHAAQVAEALLRDFTAAQALRDAYAEQSE